MKLVFAGTPGVAVPSLEALMGSGHDVVAAGTRSGLRSSDSRFSNPFTPVTWSFSTG